MTEEETKEPEATENSEDAAEEVETAEPEAGEESPAEEGSSAETTQSSGKPKVLIAEDNPVIRKSLNNFLNKWGYQSVEVESGDDAVKLLDDQPDIRLAILDWNLPGLSGMQVCQRVRSRPTAQEYVYIIMFSARKSVEEQIMALDGGADDYLVKPSKPSVLRARLGVGRRLIELALGQTT